MDKEHESDAAADEADALLSGVDKVPAGCKRDHIYTSAIMTLLRHENRKRAEALLDRFSDKSQADRLRDAMVWSEIDQSFAKNDREAIPALLQKITSYDMRAMGFAKLARAAFERRELSDGYQAVDDAAKSVEKLDQPKAKSAVYMALGVLLLNPDRARAFEMLDKGITNLNKLETDQIWKYENSLEIRFSCEGSSSSWGLAGGLAGTDIFEAIRSFVTTDLDQTNTATDAITDKATKLRSQAIVAKAGLAKYRTSSK
jgi:hypothetical protein